MNLVGHAGQGRKRLARLLPVRRADAVRRARARARRRPRSPSAATARPRGCARNIEAHGWDGEWYRRAYFDDGTPLGSAANAECQIDSIAQSWSVLSGAGDRASASRSAMDALDQRLVRRDARLVQLLDPPFDKSRPESRLHQGLRARRARERRPVHPRARSGRRWRSPRSASAHAPGSCSRMINPVNHAQHAAASRRLQGRALRRGGRRLCVAAAHRPRRLDLVHRLGRLDVPADRGIAARRCGWKATSCGSRPACPPIGRDSSCTTATAKRSITSRCCAMTPAASSTSSISSTIAASTSWKSSYVRYRTDRM